LSNGAELDSFLIKHFKNSKTKLNNYGNSNYLKTILLIVTSVGIMGASLYFFPERPITCATDAVDAHYKCYPPAGREGQEYQRNAAFAIGEMLISLTHLLSLTLAAASRRFAEYSCKRSVYRASSYCSRVRI